MTGLRLVVRIGVLAVLAAWWTLAVRRHLRQRPEEGKINTNGDM